MPAGATFALSQNQIQLNGYSTGALNLTISSTNPTVGGVHQLTLEVYRTTSPTTTFANVNFNFKIVAATNTLKSRPFLLVNATDRTEILGTLWKQSVVQSYYTAAANSIATAGISFIFSVYK